MSEMSEKPPVGIMPESIYDNSCNDQRVEDIILAIHRYARAEMIIPEEWADELWRRTRPTGTT